jgi:hypothetical protein
MGPEWPKTILIARIPVEAPVPPSGTGELEIARKAASAAVAGAEAQQIATPVSPG